MLQYVGVFCSVLQCELSVLSSCRRYCQVLWVTVCCSVMQYVAVCCSMLQCAAVLVIGNVTLYTSCVLQCVAVCHSVLQCVTVCCSVLHRDAVRCSCVAVVLQRVAVLVIGNITL